MVAGQKEFRSELFLNLWLNAMPYHLIALHVFVNTGTVHLVALLGSVRPALVRRCNWGQSNFYCLLTPVLCETAFILTLKLSEIVIKFYIRTIKHLIEWLDAKLRSSELFFFWQIHLLLFPSIVAISLSSVQHTLQALNSWLHTESARNVARTTRC